MVERYYSDVFYFVASKVGIEKAEEVAQAAMLRILENISSLKKRSSAKSWMLAVANSECSDYFRKLNRERKHTSDIEIDEDSAVAESRHLPDTVLETEETRKMVLEAIRALPQSFSDCLVLFYFNDESYASIARILDIPESRVKSNLYEGRKLLKKSLEGKLDTKSAFESVAGAAPLLTTVFERDAQTLITPEKVIGCKDYLNAHFEGAIDLSGAAGARHAPTAKIIGVGAASVSVVAIALGAYLFLSSGQDPEAIPQTLPAESSEKIVPGESAEEPSQDEPATEEPVLPIETVSDMIGEDNAQTLESFAELGTTQDAWDSFVGLTGAASADVGHELEVTYELYTLEKQGKLLLMITKGTSGSSAVSVRYVFGEMAEIPPMVELTFLFDNQA